MLASEGSWQLLKQNHPAMLGTDLPKSEKLCAKKDIDTLFLKGKSVRQNQLLLRFLMEDGDAETAPCRMLFSVPKRNVKSAVRRNRIKRMLREIYRNNKALWWKLSAASNKTIAIAVIYTGREVPTFGSLKVAFELAAKRISSSL
jgi:ribonuclease P protein component